MSAKPVLKIAVRELVAFTAASGDLRPRRFGVSTSALEGIWGHQRLQKARPEGYEAEVRVKDVRDCGDFDMEISGRIDGVFTQEMPVIVEEIKTTRMAFEDIDDHAHRLHLAQAVVYAAIYAIQQSLDEVDVRVTYLNVDTQAVDHRQERYSRDALTEQYEAFCAAYLAWAQKLIDYRKARDVGIAQLAFPFEFRQGQRRFAAEVYRAVRDGSWRLCQAPTGIGKSAGALFPAIKAMGEGRCDRLFYLTAKTVGRHSAEKALQLMRQTGLQLKAVTLTARDKICFNAPCDPETCEYAIGYYDRIRKAVDAAFEHDDLDRTRIEAVAREHQVCPFELSLDLSAWVDVIIADYNYAFDPAAFLRRYFGGDARNQCLLIDEAHNLVDRTRDMYSAQLDKSRVLKVKRSLAKTEPTVAKALDRVNRKLLALRKTMTDPVRIGDSPPENLAAVLQSFCKVVEERLAELDPSDAPEGLIDLYFEVRRFQRTLELFHDRYVVIERLEDRHYDIKLFCRDPSKLIRAFLAKSKAALFFSATLEPFDYYQRLLLGSAQAAPTLSLPSPFDPQRLCLVTAPYIATRYRRRAQSIEPLVDLIHTTVTTRAGHYLVFFPSYAYLAQVVDVFETSHPHIPVLRQERAMDEAARDAFLARFESSEDSLLVGFAVMGGIFGEGVDLVGDALIGVVVVGVGLPSLSVERDLIRDYFQREGDGYAYAYQIPGMQRVLQTAGRVIRHERDRGVVCLVDDRFEEPRYRRLFPRHWRAQSVTSSEALGLCLNNFWQDREKESE